MGYSPSITFASFFSGMLLCSSLVHATQSNIFPKDVYVSLKNSGEIAKFPGSVKWKGDPVMLYNSVTPDGKRLVVSSPKKKAIYVFDTQSKELLAKVNVGKASKGLKISPDGTEVYVANEGESSVSVVSLSTYKELVKIPTEEMPHNIRFNNNGTLAYVTLQGGAGLGVIDTKSRQVIDVIPVPGIIGPHNLDLSKNEDIAFVRDTAGSIAVLDLHNKKVKKVIKVGNGHAGVDVSVDGKFVYSGAIADDIVTVIDAHTYKKIGDIKVGFGPHGLRASKDGRWLYVVVTVDNLLVTIDTQSLKVVKKDKISDFPFWVSVNGNP